MVPTSTPPPPRNPAFTCLHGSVKIWSFAFEDCVS